MSQYLVLIYGDEQAIGQARVVGFRVGFVVRALSWLGLSIGLAIGLRITPRLARSRRVHLRRERPLPNHLGCRR